MRHLFLTAALLVLVLSACSSPPTLSAGCANVNDPFYDSAYESASVFFSPFKMGETLSVRAERNETPEVYLEIVDTRDDSRVLASLGEAGSTRYTFEVDADEVELYWTTVGGAADWQVKCSPSPL